MIPPPNRKPSEPDGLRPFLDALKQNVDITSLRKNLPLTPQQRLEQLMERQRFADELRRAGAAQRKKTR